ncbi:MAG: tetratricopeptide repeat protein, partial [Opitutales bacterium]
MSERITQFRQKLSTSPENLLFKYSLAQALFEENHFDEAIELFEQCIANRTDWMLVALYLGKAYLETGNSDNSEKYLPLTSELGQKPNHDDPVEE